jgi:hypothetical protein
MAEVGDDVPMLWLVTVRVQGEELMKFLAPDMAITITAPSDSVLGMTRKFRNKAE